MRNTLPLLSALLFVTLASGCGLEGAVFGPISDQGSTVLPEPRDTILIAQASGMGGAPAKLYTTGATTPEGGETLVETTEDAEGRIVFSLPGELAATGAIVWVESPTDLAVGVIPEIPRAASVFHESRIVRAWEQHPTLADLDGFTTAATFILMRATQELGLALDALTPASIQSALDAIDAEQQSSSSTDVAEFTSMVWAILECWSYVGSVGVAPFGAADGGPNVTLSAEWLTSTAERFKELEAFDWCDRLVIDHSADDDSAEEDIQSFIDSQVFDSKLSLAASGIELGVCYEEDRIPVVFHVDLSSGALDGNCSAANPYKHTTYSAQKSVFFTGGVHGETPVCGEGRSDFCLTEAEIDATNALLGDWIPNVVPMFDDGTNGDAKANDGVWTLVLNLPYWVADLAPDGAGVRLGYKYTFGQAGTGWTDSEEWPGNRRLLELVDVNDDRRIVRYDVFGDEASNKDFVNQLSPANGGCGFVTWETVASEGCAGETRENEIDTDDDCVPDTFDSPGPVTPLMVDC